MRVLIKRKESKTLFRYPNKIAAQVTVKPISWHFISKFLVQNPKAFTASLAQKHFCLSHFQKAQTVYYMSHREPFVFARALLTRTGKNWYYENWRGDFVTVFGKRSGISTLYFWEHILKNRSKKSTHKFRGGRCILERLKFFFHICGIQSRKHAKWNIWYPTNQNSFTVISSRKRRSVRHWNFVSLFVIDDGVSKTL